MKIKLHIPLSPGGRQVVSAGLMLVLGMAVIVVTKDYTPRTFESVDIIATPADAADETAPHETDVSGADGIDRETDMSVETASSPEAEQETAESSVRLNMAYVYPDGADAGNAWDSYAGQACELLSGLDSGWVSGMYGKMKSSPEEMAGELGISRNGIMGLYNPSAGTQVVDDPDTWVVPSWSKSQVIFQDGDGNQISGYSNIKDIVAAASVYAYRQGGMDGEEFVQLCRQLWEASHHYTVLMGEVYYCDGTCQMEIEASEEAGETGESEAEAGAETTAVPSLDGDLEVPETSELSIAEKSSEQVSTESESQSSATTTEDRSEPSESVDYSEIRSRYSLADVPADWESYEGPAREVWEQVIAAYGEEMPSSAAFTGSEEEVICPGHIDLEIKATILGLYGTRSLFDVEAFGNAPAVAGDSGETADIWQGFTKMNRHHARCIWNQNWETIYGLPVVSTLYMGNPLSADEISFYMDMLPEDITVFQRELIRQALQSVGCIPYYWGGKAYTAGYDGNDFGAVIADDGEGRRLRGLDCSGWINWVYWTALGTRLEFEGTSGLTQVGSAITRSQLQPGDIIVRTNTETAHVYLFLAWASDGEMYVIHETSGDINNVTVSKLDADGPHYRRLLGNGP